MDEDREASRLWRVYKTVHEMVSHRGYMVSKAELELSLDEFRQQYTKNGFIDRQSLTFLVQHSTSPGDQLLVFFTDEDSVGIKPIKK
nr:DNA-directed RNA polymerases II 24 kDa polypeptide (RNA polymerase II subunit 5) [Polyrhizophydium stewartii]